MLSTDYIISLTTDHCTWHTNVTQPVRGSYFSAVSCRAVLCWGGLELLPWSHPQQKHTQLCSELPHRCKAPTAHLVHVSLLCLCSGFCPGATRWSAKPAAPPCLLCPSAEAAPWRWEKLRKPSPAAPLSHLCSCCTALPAPASPAHPMALTAPKALGVGFPGSLVELGGTGGTQKDIEGLLASPCRVCGVCNCAAEMQPVPPARGGLWAQMSRPGGTHPAALPGPLLKSLGRRLGSWEAGYVHPCEQKVFGKDFEELIKVGQ